MTSVLAGLELVASLCFLRPPGPPTLRRCSPYLLLVFRLDSATRRHARHRFWGAEGPTLAGRAPRRGHRAAAASAVRASTENSHSATGLWARFLAVFQEPDSITTGPNRAVGRPGGSEPDAAAPALKTLYRVMAADEIERIVLILRRWSMNSAILVGTPGVRRTAIAEGVAWRVAAGVVPKARVVEIAGKEGYDAFLERLEKAEADDYWEVVLFIEDVHLLLGSAKGVTDLLKSGMEDGYFHCVCTTTLEEYRRKHVQKDAAFERLFQKVHVQEPSLLETISVLQGLKNQYQKRHNAVIEDAAIVAAARLANRHITGALKF
ncbi:hypothetical protein PR202_gb08700 [Eleusine coracana subsp. coracana]|uniref:ClpA/ClpB AAA lid domain-containing protein n=1 Tax=Eleusine coracana subsp. coracana TaxID=191504 RepID=A0AAV5ECY3_ELECO|nr:hypothetical protein PR202_gb08700 [Eleusine coracana subsp. coracana]